MPIDFKSLAVVIYKLLDRGHINLEKMSHEQMVTNTVYNKAIADVLDTIKGIENGNIDVKELTRK